MLELVNLTKMSQRTISFNRYKVNHHELLKLHNDGYRVICPLYKSEIKFATSGSWCSKNPNHYETHIYSGEAKRMMRESRIERGIKKTRENLTKKGYSEAQIQAEIDKYYPNR